MKNIFITPRKTTLKKTLFILNIFSENTLQAAIHTSVPTLAHD